MAQYTKARPTIYKGIRMRSRLEADYARQLDEDGEDWEYEPVAYADAQHTYLPDFVLDGGLVIDEVKSASIKPWEADMALIVMHAALSSEPDATLRVMVPSRFDAGTRANTGWRIAAACRPVSLRMPVKACPWDECPRLGDWDALLSSKLERRWGMFVRFLKERLGPLSWLIEGMGERSRRLSIFPAGIPGLWLSVTLPDADAAHSGELAINLDQHEPARRHALRAAQACFSSHVVAVDFWGESWYA